METEFSYSIYVIENRFKKDISYREEKKCSKYPYMSSVGWGGYVHTPRTNFRQFAGVNVPNIPNNENIALTISVYFLF